MLNESSDVRRCDPANCRDCRSANEKPNPCTNPKPKAIIQRRCTVPAPTIFSSAMYTIEAAMSTSMSGGNHRKNGAEMYAERISVKERAKGDAVTTGTRARKRRQ